MSDRAAEDDSGLEPEEHQRRPFAKAVMAGSVAPRDIDWLFARSSGFATLTRRRRLVIYCLVVALVAVCVVIVVGLVTRHGRFVADVLIGFVALTVAALLLPVGGPPGRVGSSLDDGRVGGKSPGASALAGERHVGDVTLYGRAVAHVSSSREHTTTRRLAHVGGAEGGVGELRPRLSLRV